MDLIWNGKRLLVPSIGNHIIWNPSPGYPLLDRDGNEYTTAIIGTQEWTIENLKTTKYADGTSIPNLTENSVPNLFSGWTNTSWDTFVSGDVDTLDITSFIKSAGPTGYARTELEPFTSGNHLHLIFTISLNSGSAPSIQFIEEGYGQVATYNTAAGFGYIDYNIPFNGNWQVQLTSNASGTDGSIVMQISAIPAYGWAEDKVGARCEYNNSTGTYKEPYGYLYNWYAINNIHNIVYFKRNNVQETGWRIPSDDDWITLSTYAGGLSVAGGKLKETGTSHWQSPNDGATDDYGFKALPGGIRSILGTFTGVLSNQGVYWASDAYVYEFHYDDAIMSRYDFSSLKRGGLSVRCVRDI